MASEISAAPLGSPADGASPPSPAQSPQSTVLGSGLNSPWLDPASPTSPIHDPKRASMMALLGSNRAEQTNTGLGLISHDSPTKEGNMFQKFLKSKLSMVLSLFVGIVGALAHHFFYAYLKGQDAENQERNLRIGQFISFVSKTGFGFAVLMAQQQLAWRAVARKDYSVHAIDSLFGASHSVLELFCWEAWKKSWWVMSLSLYIAISPLLVIFASATLGVSLEITEERNAECKSVRTLNFSHESYNEWDNPKRDERDGLIRVSLSTWELTGERGDNDTVEYWALPSTQFEGLADKVFTANQAIPRDNVAEEVCGRGWDCSTVINFVGPGYKCDSITPKPGISIDDFAGVEAPFNMSGLAPEGNHIYFARTMQGDYGDQIKLKDDGKPERRPPYPRNLGAFKTEPIIWDGRKYTPAVLACEHYVTNYTVNLTYTGGLQSYNVTHRDYMHKVINTTYKETLDTPTPDGLLNGVVAVPENYIFPTKENMEAYRYIATYHSFGKVLRAMMNGTITLPNHITRSDVVFSRLVHKRDYIAIPNLEEGIRRLYEDMLISLLSYPQMLVVSWAGDDSKSSGTLRGGPGYPCYRHKLSNKFVYKWKTLVAVYVTSCAIALAAVAFGILAMRWDGLHEQREINFSEIAGATKSISLDQHRDKKAMIRCVDMGEGPAGQVYEFRLRDSCEQENGSRSALHGKPAVITKETAV